MFNTTQIPDEQRPSDECSTSKDEKNRSRPFQKLKKSQTGRDIPRAFKKENKFKITKKLTKS